MFRPVGTKDMKTPMRLIVVSKYEKVKGVSIPKYEEKDIIYCSFKTYGGTEKVINGRYVIEDTATIVTWYRPDIQSDCLLKKLSNDATYEILGEPENIEDKNMFLKFKIRRVKGKA